MVKALRYGMLAAIAALTLGQAAQAGTMAVSFTGASYGQTGTDLTAGWAFTTTSSLTILALDDYAPMAGGNLVQLYDGTGTVLASTTVLTSDPIVAGVPASLPSDYHSHAIAPVVLGPGTYYIAADLKNGQPGQGYLAKATGMSTIAGLTYLHGDLALGLGQKPMTDTLLGGGLDPAYFGPNFEATSAAGGPAATPLPGAAWMGMGLVGALGIGRKLRRARA